VALVIRRAVLKDAARLLTFPCANAGEPWTKSAQDLIREDIAEAVRDDDAGLSVFVAVDDEGHVVGVVASSRSEQLDLFIHVLAVTAPFRRRGIGLELKQHAMHEFGDVRSVISEVHHRNVAMNGLNAKLNAATARSPDDYKYLASYIEISPPE
jgi:ribosomal protein S18 acetylase RimI-like enzyme